MGIVQLENLGVGEKIMLTWVSEEIECGGCGLDSSGPYRD
jgi:hypothetical protein